MRLGRLVEALEAGDEFFGEGFAGLGPQEATRDAAVLLDGEGEGEEFFDVLLDALGGVLVELVVGEGVSMIQGVSRPKSTRMWPFWSKLASSNCGAEAEDADGGGLEAPGGVGWVGGIFGIFGVVDDGEVGVDGLKAGAGVTNGVEVRCPEFPAHFELVGHVFVEEFGGFGDGVFDDGGLGGLGAVVVDEEALVGGWLGEVDGVGGCGGDTGVAGDERELAQHGDERGGEGLEAKVGKPHAEVELIGHE